MNILHVEWDEAGIVSVFCIWCWFANQVMAQVSCEMTVPKDSRPNEGSLLLNVELSPMAAPHFEAGRRTDEAVCCDACFYCH